MTPVIGPWLRLRQAHARIALLDRALMRIGAEVRGLEETLAVEREHAADLTAQVEAQLRTNTALSRENARLRDTLRLLDQRLTVLQRANEVCDAEHARLVRAHALQEGA